MDRVSIIIPSYGENTEPCRAIDSVFAQNYEDVEVIVVDDNGMGTVQQLKNQALFQKYDGNSRFKYIIHETNRGGSVARNTGAKACSGNYLCFLDDDDFFSDVDKIKKQIQVDKTLDDTWAGTYSSLHKYLGDKSIREIEAKQSGTIVEDFIRGETSIGTAAPIIRRACYDDIGGFDGSFRRHQDWEFFARLTDRYQLKAVPEAYYDRSYKSDVARRSIESRIANMDKYVAKMRESIKSIPPRKLESLMKKKYISIVFALFKQKDFKTARKIMKNNKFGIKEYAKMCTSVFSYIRNRAKYGSHF